MNTDENNQDVVVDTQNTNEGEGETNNDLVQLSKTEYEKLNQTLGSLKRELKDLKKPKEETKETSKTNQPDEVSQLKEKLDKQALRSAQITHQDDIELARNTAKKWNMDLDDVLVDQDFQAKLERQRTSRSNIEATSGVRGGGAGGTQAKNTLEYWKEKGVPPTPADVPNSEIRRKIVRGMLSDSKTTKGKFYNS